MLAYIVSQEEHSGLWLAANNRKIWWSFSEVKLHGRSDKGTYLITKNKNHLKTKLSLSVVTMGNQYQSMSLIKGTVKWVCRDIIFVAQKLIQSNSISNHLNYSVNAKLCLPSSQSSVL